MPRLTAIWHTNYGTTRQIQSLRVLRSEESIKHNTKARLPCSTWHEAKSGEIEEQQHVLARGLPQQACYQAVDERPTYASAWQTAGTPETALETLHLDLLMEPDAGPASTPPDAVTKHS
ncbi:hypothetical protein VTJ04DRAFT_8026 [Mycothermus thermophilus]|uniref:uncharacterized protein n=1 Tax=Humicola insolens TaxID=85995 RepID=UPI003741F95A